ncbi:MAG: AAA family ATPase [Candidatus Helarchaeota archaeon]
MIQLNKLILENFKSYKKQEITFFDGYNFLIGKNGAGKSTVLEAIIFAFFGRVKNRDKTIKNDDLIRRGTTSFQVILEFTLNGNQYKVVRTNKLKAKEAEAQLYHDGSLLAEKARTVTREIEELLRIDRDTFQNVVHVGQGEIPEIATKQAGKRKELFDRFLQLDRYDKMHSSLQPAQKELEIQIDSIKETINDLKKDTEDYEENKTKLKEEENQLENLRVEEAKLKEEKQSIEKKLAEEKAKKEEIDKQEARLKEISDQFKRIKENIKKKQEELADIGEDKIPDTVKELKQLESKLTDKKSKLEEEDKSCNLKIEGLKQIQTEIVMLQEELERNEESLNKIQSYLREKVKEIKKHDSSFKEESTTEKLTEYETKLSKIDKKLSGLNVKIEQVRILENQVLEINLKIKNFQENQDKSVKESEECKKQLNKLNPRWKSFLKDNSEEQIKNKIESLDTKLNDLNERISRVTGSKEALIARLNELKDERKSVEELKEGAKCTSCKQTINKKHKEKVLEAIDIQIDGKEKELQKESAEEKRLNIEKNEIQEQLRVARDNESNFLKIKPLQEKLEAALQDAETNRVRIEELKIELIRIKIDEDSKVLEDQIEKCRNEKKRFETLISAIQVILTYMKQRDDVQKQIKDKKIQIEKKEKEFDADELSKLEKRANELDQSVKDLIGHIKSITELSNRITERNEVQGKMNEVIKAITKISMTFDLDAFNQLQEEEKKVSSDLTEHTTKIQTIEKKVLPQMKDKIKSQEDKLKKLKEKEKKLIIDEKTYKIIKFLRVFTREITPVLRLQHIQKISQKATEFFSNLINSSEYGAIEISPNYDLLIQRYGIAEDITNLSGGEQVIACLAIRMAIAEVLAKQGLILLDEPTVFLDETRIEALGNIFQQFRPVKQMIAVTHDERFMTIADYSMVVEKEKRQSVVRI